MKIYEIGTGYTPIPAQMGAATEIVVEELTRSFIKLNKNVEIIDIADENRVENDLPIIEVKVPSLFAKADVSLGIMHKLKRVAYSVALAGKLRKILKKSNEDTILHFHNQYNMFFFLKLVPEKYRRKAKIAYTNHNGYWSLEWKDIESVLRKRYFQEIECMKKADMVFVLNEQTKQNAIQHLNIAENRITDINNGVNTDIYKPLTDAEIKSIKEKYDFNNKKIILQVGSVCENKGQKRTLEALLPLLKKNDDLVYAYVGGIIEDSYQEKIDNYIKDNELTEKVFYLGVAKPGNDLNELYNMSELTVFMSKYEGFPLVVLESLASGTPIITCLERGLNFGKGCINCKPDELSSAVEEIICDYDIVKSLSSQARENAQNSYTWEVIAENYSVKFRKSFEEKDL